MHTSQALVDSGAEGNFIDSQLANNLQVPIFPLKQEIAVKALNGQNLHEITHATGTVTLITSGNHTEEICFLLTNSPHTPIVLGHPWLILHNARIDWGHNSVSSWSNHCHASCLVSAGLSVVCSVL